MIGAVLLVAVLSAGESAPAGARAGSALCMPPLPGALAFGSEGKGGATNSYDDSEEARRRRRSERHVFIVKLDGDRDMRIDQKRGGCFEDLTYQGAHVVVLRRSDGSPVGSARFSFERWGVTELELRYDPFYGSVIIEAPRHPRRSATPGVSATATPERALGTLDTWSDHVTIPEAGLRLRFRAPTARSHNVRSMLSVTASAAPVEGHPAVRLTTSVSGSPATLSSSSCLEARGRNPPFETCTTKAGNGWHGGGAREVVVMIDNLAGHPVSVELRIVVMDPLE